MHRQARGTAFQRGVIRAGVLVCAVWAVAAAQAPPALPDELEDQAFWRLVSDLSSLTAIEDVRHAGMQNAAPA
jgi:hypothetical protein